METKLQKLKNSDGIKKVNIFLKSFDLKTNDKVELNFEDNLIISKLKNKITLKERFKKYKGENQAKNFTWDEPKGKEL